MIGYLPETVPLYADMLVDEYLHFIGEARHMNGKFQSRYDWVVQAAGLEPVLHRKIGVLSKGFKQRTCLAQALIHDPDVLILDEPTSGLDPLQIIGIRKLIKNLAHEKTIILSTHILPEVATIADRILVINEGRIVADGSFDELRKIVTKQSSVYIAVKSSKKDFESALKSVSGIQDVEYDDNRRRGEIGAHLFFKSSVDSIGKLNDLIRDNKWEILEFHPEKLSLEDSFIRLTQATGSNENEVKQVESVSEEGGAA
jgi:ABC-2 type transport system ATP-binding protein